LGTSADAIDRLCKKALTAESAVLSLLEAFDAAN
jgi:hypothetical protein